MLNSLTIALNRQWRGSFGRSVSLLAGGTAFGQAVIMLASPLLTRLYSTEDFGNLQVYTSILMFAFAITALRYEWAILLPEKETVAANLVVLALGTVAVTSVTFGGVTWWWSQHSTLLPEAEPLRPYWWLMPLAICGAGIYQVLSQWALRQKAYTSLAATKLTQAIFQVTIQIIMGVYLKGGILGLLVGDAVGRMSGSLRLARESWQKTRILFHSFSGNELWQTAVRYRHFPLISSGSALINTAGLALPPLLLAGLYGPQVTGWFALSDRVMHVPFVLIGRAVSQVYSGEFARLAMLDPVALPTLYQRTARNLALVGLLPLLVMLTAGPPLFAWVFGEPWREAGNYARLLAVTHYVALIANPLTPTLMLLERQSWQLGWDIGLLGLCTGSLWVAKSLECSAKQAILVYAIVFAACYLIHLWLCKLAIDQRSRGPISLIP